MDIVEVLEIHAVSLGWRFSYGNKANQNLLQSDLVDDRIYLVLDPVKRLYGSSEFGGDGEVTFTSRFFLVVKSTIDQTYHNQTNEEVFINRIKAIGGTVYENVCFANNIPGKYTQNIKPLLTDSLPTLKNLIDCSKYEITNWGVLDAINVFDANLDGLIVDFTIKVL